MVAQSIWSESFLGKGVPVKDVACAGRCPVAQWPLSQPQAPELACTEAYIPLHTAGLSNIACKPGDRLQAVYGPTG